MRGLYLRVRAHRYVRLDAALVDAPRRFHVALEFVQEGPDGCKLQALPPVGVVQLHVVDEVVYHALELVGLRVDDGQGVLHLVHVRDHPVGEGFGVALDEGDGGAQVVADSHDELGAPVLLVLERVPHLFKAGGEGGYLVHVPSLPGRGNLRVQRPPRDFLRRLLKDRDGVGDRPREVYQHDRADDFERNHRKNAGEEEDPEGPFPRFLPEFLPVHLRPADDESRKRLVEK